MRYTASPLIPTPTRSSVIWSATNATFWNDVGTTATESHGHLKQVAPCPLDASTRPRRQCTRNSDGFAVTKPHFFVLAGSSTGLPVRQPACSRAIAVIVVVTMRDLHCDRRAAAAPRAVAHLRRRAVPAASDRVATMDR